MFDSSPKKEELFSPDLHNSLGAFRPMPIPRRLYGVHPLIVSGLVDDVV